jgi:hypothetical protein
MRGAPSSAITHAVHGIVAHAVLAGCVVLRWDCAHVVATELGQNMVLEGPAVVCGVVQTIGNTTRDPALERILRRS